MREVEAGVGAGLDSERLREIVLDLKQAQARERQLRLEADTLLHGLKALTLARDSAEVFGRIMEVLREPLGFEQAFVLSAAGSPEGELRMIASTAPVVGDARWCVGALFSRALEGEVIISVETAQVWEWQQRPVAQAAQVRSAIYIPIIGERQRALLIATHSQRVRFDHRHKQMASRFKPLISQAMARVEQLEALAQANREMRLVLDTVEQGMATVGLSGELKGQRSKRFIDWFGDAPGALWDALASADSGVAAWLEMTWEDLSSEFMPLEVVLAQLPTRLSRGEQRLSLAYQPIFGAQQRLEAVLVVASDITEELALAKAQQQQQEFAHAVTRLVRDRQSFVDFFEDTQAMVEALQAGHQDHATVMRQLHTLKGNCGLFHVQSVAACCHEIEGDCANEQRGPTAQELERLALLWAGFVKNVEPLMHASDGSFIELDEDDYQRFIAALERGQGAQQLKSIVESWRLAPVKAQLERLGEQAGALAQRLGKPQPRISVDAHGVRLDAQRYRSFWAACVHVVRNAVDHGLEDSQTRAQHGKPPQGALTLCAKHSPSTQRVVVEISDDGGGIDWEKLVSKAAARGINEASAQSLLFVDGLSSREEASEVSGRGVGMGALKQICDQLGAKIDVISHQGQGTTWRFELPQAALAS